MKRLTEKKYSLHKLKGFSIVELMVAMVLGLMLTAGVTKVYITTKDTYNLSENLSRLQENARFAMHFLAQDVRMAGFLPCRASGKFANTLDSSIASFDFGNQSFIGYEGGVSTFDSSFPTVGTSAGARVAGTDAIIFSGGGTEAMTVESHNPISANFKLNTLHTLVDDDILLVCDGKQASMMQVTNVNASNVTVVHNTGTGSIGNCTQSLGGNANCFAGAFEAHSYGPGAQLSKFESSSYYVGVSSSGNSYSLYRRKLSSGGVFGTEELLEGIENLQFLYGEDTDNDTQPESYITANNVNNWGNVVTVKVGLLAHTPDQVNKVNDTNAYNVAETSIADTGTTITHDGDQRLRFAFNSIVKLRNRGLN